MPLRRTRGPSFRNINNLFHKFKLVMVSGSGWLSRH